MQQSQQSSKEHPVSTHTAGQEAAAYRLSWLPWWARSSWGASHCLPSWAPCPQGTSSGWAYESRGPLQHPAECELRIGPTCTTDRGLTHLKRDESKGHGAVAQLEDGRPYR